MAAGGWHSLHWPSWRAWFEIRVERVQRLARATLADRQKLIRWGLLTAGGAALFFAGTVLWRALLMGAAGAALALFLQQLVDPSPLFWTVPWEAVQLVRSRKVRVNHLWLHRTQELVRESVGSSTQVDGFATPEGFLLINAGPDRQLVQWTAEFAWRAMILEDSAKKHRTGCKTTRFLFALWFMAGGLLPLGIWRGVDLPGALLVAVICGAAGHSLARPLENMLGLRVVLPAWRDGEAQLYRFQVEPVEFPELLWFHGGQGFRVSRIAAEQLGNG